MHLDFKLVHAHLAVISFRLSEWPEQAVEIASVWIHIIYQANTFRQTHRNTEASFTCPLGHKLLFLLAQHQNLLAQAIAPGCFPGLLSEGLQVNILWSIDLLYLTMEIIIHSKYFVVSAWLAHYYPGKFFITNRRLPYLEDVSNIPSSIWWYTGNIIWLETRFSDGIFEWKRGFMGNSPVIKMVFIL